MHEEISKKQNKYIFQGLERRMIIFPSQYYDFEIYLPLLPECDTPWGKAWEILSLRTFCEPTIYERLLSLRSNQESL